MSNQSGWRPIGEPYTLGKKRFVDAVCGCGARGRVGIEKGRLRSEACRVCGQRKPRHGHSIGGGTRTYRCWQSIKDRCTNSAAPAYADYGGRGIAICERWLTSFEAFLEDMGEMPDGKSIGRIDNDGGYEPTNCRWETREQQNSNTRQNVFITYGSDTCTVTDWSRRIGCQPGALLARVHRGMTAEEAIETPFDVVTARRLTTDFAQLTFNGETLTFWQWAERTGLKRTTIQERHRAGWSAEQILTTPARSYGGAKKRK